MRTTKKGFFWAIAADGCGHGGTGPPVVLFRYAPGRSGEHPQSQIEDLMPWRFRKTSSPNP